MRQRDIAALKATRLHAPKEHVEFLGAHRVLLVAAPDVVLAQPIVVDQRRARVRHGPADDAGLTHVPINPRTRSSLRRGSIVRPIIVAQSPLTLWNSWIPRPSIS